MRELELFLNLTLDGFLADTNGSLDWHYNRWEPAMNRAFCDLLHKADTLILGKNTYLAMARHWDKCLPRQSISRDDLALSDMLTRYNKVIFSKSLRLPVWPNTILVRGHLTAELSRLKQEGKKNLLLLGSISLLRPLIQSRMVDRYSIWVHPVILGRGIPFFENFESSLNLQLISTNSFPTGVQQIMYQAQPQMRSPS